MKGMVGMTCMIDRKIEKGEGRGPGYAQQCGPVATAVESQPRRRTPESQPWHDPWIPTRCHMN